MVTEFDVAVQIFYFVFFILGATALRFIINL